MIHGARQIRVGEGDAAKRCVAENLARCRPALHSKEEARLGIQIRVAPAVQDDSGNVPAGIEARGSKYLAELFADPSFIVHERRSDHLSTAPVPLAFGGKSRKRVQNFQTEYDGPSDRCAFERVICNNIYCYLVDIFLHIS